MTDETQQGFTGGDVMALGSVLLGAVAVLLAMFLPARDLLGAIVVAVIGLALAVFGSSRGSGRGTAWMARIGSVLAVIAVAIVVIVNVT